MTPLYLLLASVLCSMFSSTLNPMVDKNHYDSTQTAIIYSKEELSKQSIKTKPFAEKLDSSGIPVNIYGVQLIDSTMVLPAPCMLPRRVFLALPEERKVFMLNNPHLYKIVEE